MGIVIIDHLLREVLVWAMVVLVKLNVQLGVLERLCTRISVYTLQHNKPLCYKRFDGYNSVQDANPSVTIGPSKSIPDQQIGNVADMHNARVVVNG